MKYYKNINITQELCHELTPEALIYHSSCFLSPRDTHIHSLYVYINVRAIHLLLLLLHEFEQRNFKKYLSVFVFISVFVNLPSVREDFQQRKSFWNSMHSVYDSSPRNNNIIPEKRNKKKTSLFVYLFGKRPVSFWTTTQRAINITF